MTQFFLHARGQTVELEAPPLADGSSFRDNKELVLEHIGPRPFLNAMQVGDEVLLAGKTVITIGTIAEIRAAPHPATQGIHQEITIKKTAIKSRDTVNTLDDNKASLPTESDRPLTREEAEKLLAETRFSAFRSAFSRRHQVGESETQILLDELYKLGAMTEKLPAENAMAAGLTRAILALTNYLVANSRHNSQTLSRLNELGLTTSALIDNFNRQVDSDAEFRKRTEEKLTELSENIVVDQKTLNEELNGG